MPRFSGFFQWALILLYLYIFRGIQIWWARQELVQNDRSFYFKVLQTIPAGMGRSAILKEYKTLCKYSGDHGEDEYKSLRDEMVCVIRSELQYSNLYSVSLMVDGITVNINLNTLSSLFKDLPAL